MLRTTTKNVLARLSALQIRNYGVIGEAGGAFAKKGTAQEEKFIHDHEVEVMKALKEKLLKEKAELQQKINETNTKLKEKGVHVEDHPEVSPESLGYSTTGSGLGGPVRAGGGAFAYVTLT
jgi:hypothetical protein